MYKEDVKSHNQMATKKTIAQIFLPTGAKMIKICEKNEKMAKTVQNLANFFFSQKRWKKK